MYEYRALSGAGKYPRYRIKAVMSLLKAKMIHCICDDGDNRSRVSTIHTLILLGDNYE